MSNLELIIEDSFQQYAGAVLQSRALVDVRDCLKPSARQIFYCLYTDKFIHSKPFKKTLKCIGSAMRMYIHGDSSCEGVIMRAGQPFSMRYPLIEVEGSYGNLMESGNWSAPRYTSARLSALAEYLFKDIDKDTIEEWRDNYDDTEQYPSVLPSKGFFNIVNGTMGIGVGAASSIPQFNLREVNEKLAFLLENPDASFEDIYCAPDFATGAVLLNEKEVKLALKNGYGSSCKLRSVIEYNKYERSLIVKEIPYSVYTNTICKELEEILESEENPGIERFNDLTGSTPNIKIYLKRNANPDRVLKYLYKNTSLQSYYGINMTILEKGRYPKTVSWKDLLQSYIDHEKDVYRRGFEFEINKKLARIHVLEGILICLASIDEVVTVIKNSATTAAANKSLQEKFLLDQVQAKAVLELKLSRLAHLEVEKIENEKKKLENEVEELREILNNESKFNEQLINDWNEVARKFGDGRRTQILNIEDEDDEPKELRKLSINLSNQNNIYIHEVSTLYSQSRGGVGKKFKMNRGEFIISTQQGDNQSTILFFSKNGNYYHAKLSDIATGEVVPIESISAMPSGEEICFMQVMNKETLKNDENNIIFFTKHGFMKKSKLSEYNTTRQVGAKALSLESGDEICSAIVTNNDRVGMLTARGQFVICETKDIRPIGRVAKGVKGIKLNEGDSLKFAMAIPQNTKEIISISELGYSKRTPITEFTVTNRGVKGGKIHRLKDTSDELVSFLPISTETDVIVVANNAQIKIKLSDISLLSKGAQGTKSIKITESAKVVGITIF